ncbi:MAG: hypothetical protein ACREPG_10525, partial [Candidatus Binatia bacterium]
MQVSKQSAARMVSRCFALSMCAGRASAAIASFREQGLQSRLLQRLITLSRLQRERLWKVKAAMRVKQIFVKNLFGVFDHTIPLNMEGRITIIHGPNGFGKTIMFEMLNGFFNSQYSVWRTIPFEEFRVDFEGGSFLRILPFKGNSNPILDVYDEKGNQASIHLPDKPSADDATTEVDTEHGAKQDKSNRTGTPTPDKRIWAPETEWLNSLRKSVSIHFVLTDRLRKKKANRPVFEHTVSRYSKELTEIIQSALAEYGEVSQALDRTFPVRVIKEASISGLSEQELRQKLRSLEEKRTHLISAGLLDSDGAVDSQLQQEIDDRTKSVLSVYVSDTEKKLGVLDKLAAKIDLFKRIVTQRLLYTNMAVGKEKGFIFMTPDNQPLPGARLSSGEQHELVLLYELLF